MEPGFPTIPSDSDLTTVVNILQNNHAVLVIDKGQIIGVINIGVTIVSTLISIGN
jgi:predicted transcriptional regulator